MGNIRRFCYTILNIVLGGMALVAAIISHGRSSQPDALYFYLIGLFMWIFGLSVFISKPDDEVPRLLYLMSVGMMSVCSVDATFSANESGWVAKFVPLFQFAATAFLPCIFLRCYAVFPSVKRFAMNRFFRWWVYAPGIFLFAAMSISYLTGNSYQRWFFLIDIYPLRIPNLLYLFVYSVAGHACLLHTFYTGETRTQRKQAKWLFLGIGTGTIPVAFFYTIPSVLGIEFPYGRFSAYTLILIMLCYGIAILRHRLMDIDLAINRSSVYAAVSSAALVVYLVSSQVLGTIFSAISPRSGSVVTLFSILIVALLFAPMKQRIQEFIDKRFYQRRYNYRRTLLSLSESLSTMLRLDELSETLLNQLSEALQPRFASVLLRKDSGSLYQKGAVTLETEIKGAVFQVYKQVGNEVRLRETLEESNLESMKDNPERVSRKGLAVPLLSKGSLIGVILLGGKLSGEDYNAEDISLMKMLSYQAAISIENAVIYERLREQVDSMRNAHSRLVEAFRRLYPDHTPPEKPVSESADIISELDMIAEALIRSSENLRELDELKSQFLSLVSHELRTPLTAIKGHADNLLGGFVGKLDERQEKRVERMSRNCERLVRMVEDLLNLSRIVAGRIEFNPAKLSLSSLVNETLFEFASFAKEKEVSLVSECPPELTVVADGDKLEETIINLLDNAIKFTPPGGKISVCVEEKGECVYIAVEDTGIGIPTESLSKIFDRFHQVQKEEKRESEGMGIGLAIVKSFV